MPIRRFLLTLSLATFGLALAACADDAGAPTSDGAIQDGQVLRDGRPDGPSVTPDLEQPDTVNPCGNGVADTGEDCDGGDLASKDCKALGFDKGTLSCKADCRFDTSACQHENCGNSKLDGNEDCDGTLLGGKDCKSQGFDGGSLACNANCSFDTSGCTKCGDGAINQAIEQCDGADLGGKQCKDVGSYTGGTLKCSATCQYDKTGCTSGSGKTLTKFFLMHHSVGEGIVNGGMRATITTHNTANGTSFELWDQMLYGTDINNASGTQVSGGGYDVHKGGITTRPSDYEAFWTGSTAARKAERDKLLGKHEVIAFKSCYLSIEPSAADFELGSGALTTWKNRYNAMRSFFDTRKDRLFVVMTPPPTVASASNKVVAQRARDFANWLCSSAYLAGHPNVVCYDLFDKLANPATASTEANMMMAKYRTDEWDSHPNATARKMLATDFATFLINAAKTYKATP
jgi:hypothetical protein